MWPPNEGWLTSRSPSAALRRAPRIARPTLLGAAAEAETQTGEQAPTAVLDASALLAPVHDEQGSEAVANAIAAGAGLSLADRACLALAKRLGLPVVSADRSRTETTTDVEVRLIRRAEPSALTPRGVRRAYARNVDSQAARPACWAGAERSPAPGRERGQDSHYGTRRATPTDAATAGRLPGDAALWREPRDRQLHR